MPTLRWRHRAKGRSYRLPEAMAIGAVVVAAPPACGFPEPLLDGVHYVALKDDASDVVEVCQALLDDNERRQQIATNAMTFFDRNFRRKVSRGGSCST